MKLRPYQRQDIVALASYNAVGCFNEQRTGKTPTALMYTQIKRANKVLIVCPASVVLKWKEEFKLWLQRDCIACIGTHKQQAKAIEQWTYGLVISYDSLKETKNSLGHVAAILKQKPDAIIVDEAHRIKNYRSATAKAVFKFKKVPKKMVLTGTPAPNKQYEVWSLLHFLYPDIFPAYWGFINEYFTTKIERMGARTYTQIGTFVSKEKEQKLLRFLSVISTSHKRKDVMPWLPDKDYERIRLEPTPAQKKYLKSLLEYYEVEGTDVITQGTLDRLVRYRQICLHPGLLELAGSSPKLDYLKQYLKDYPERSVVVFTRFTSMIHLMKQDPAFKDAGVIIGQTSIKKRTELMQAFQKKKFNVLLAQTDTCKEGVTLDTAECIVFLDKYPPASDIQQAEDRFVATTEQKANKAHTIIELILKGTYDEELYTLVQNNISECDVINKFKAYLKGD